MNKSDLINTIADKANMPHKRAEEVVNIVFDSMVDSMKREERVEIRGWGSFEVRHYDAYKGRNPRTGEIIEVTPKRLPFFKVGKELKERVDNPQTTTPGL